MKQSCVYLKYKQERQNARLLKKDKKRKLANKVPVTAVPEKKKERKSVRVSLPIIHFINLQNKCTLTNNTSTAPIKNINEAPNLQTSKVIVELTSTDSKLLTQKLRQVRVRRNRNPPIKEQNQTANESNGTVMKRVGIIDYLWYILTKIHSKTCFKDDHKRKILIPVRSLNGIESLRVCYTLDEAKKALNINEAAKETQTETEQLGIENLRKTDSSMFKLDDQQPKKKTSQASLANNVDDTGIDQLNQERLNMALGHSEANKSIIRALKTQIINPNADQTVENPPPRAGTPFPFVNCNLTLAPTSFNTLRNVVDSASNTKPTFIHPSAVTPFFNSQSNTPTLSRIVHSKQLKSTSTEANERNDIRNSLTQTSQDNNLFNQVNLNTLADTANSLNKLKLPPNLVGSRKDHQLNQNQLAQKTPEEPLELLPYKYKMLPSQMLPLKPLTSQPPQSVQQHPTNMQRYQAQEPKTQQLQMPPPYPQPQPLLPSQLIPLNQLTSQPPQSVQQHTTNMRRLQALEPKTQHLQMPPPYPQPLPLLQNNSLSLQRPTQPLQTKPSLPQQQPLLPHNSLSLQLQTQPLQTKPSFPLQQPLQRSFQQHSPQFNPPNSLDDATPASQLPPEQQLEQNLLNYVQQIQRELSIQSQRPPFQETGQHPTPSQLPQTQSSEPMHQVLYPPPTQRSQMPVSYTAKYPWQQQLYYDQQQQYPQQNAQFASRQDHYYPNAFATRNQKAMKEKVQRGDVYMHPRDPRRPPRPKATPWIKAASTMPPSGDHYQRAQNVYPSYFQQQMQWNNPNHYW